MAGERTTNPHRTHGPTGDDGPSWAEYFRTRQHDGWGVVDDGLPSGGDRSSVLAAGEWTIGHSDHLPRSLVGFVKSLVNAGFEYKGKYATVFEGGGVYGPTAQKAGEQKPDRTVTSIVVGAVKPGYGYCRLLFEQANGGSWTCTWRNINGEYREVSDRQMKEWIANA